MMPFLPKTRCQRSFAKLWRIHGFCWDDQVSFTSYLQFLAWENHLRMGDSPASHVCLPEGNYPCFGCPKTATSTRAGAGLRYMWQHRCSPCNCRAAEWDNELRSRCRLCLSLEGLNHISSGHHDTVDGREILHQLKTMVNIPLFIGFQPSQIGGAGFRWPIHSISVLVHRISHDGLWSSSLGIILDSITPYKNWLLVYLPLWKIWKSVRMMTFPTGWKKQKCSKPPFR